MSKSVSKYCNLLEFILISFLSLMFLWGVLCGRALAAAVPSIELNGMDNISTFSSETALKATIELDAADQEGVPAKWWVVAETPMGWFSYIYPGGWEFSGETGADLSPAFEGLLFNIEPPLEILNMAGLPTGVYAFYFAVDILMDERLDLATSSYDRATLQVGDGLSYPVVDTGQTACYDGFGDMACPGVNDEFYGQDAQYAGNQPNYAVSNDGLTVYDNVTGLTWTQGADWNEDGTVDVDDKFTYDEAQDYINTLNTQNYGGFSDWRVPTIKELYSLIDYRGTDPMVSGTDTSELTPFINDDVFQFAYGDTTAGERIIDSQWVTTTLYVGKVMNDRTAMFGVNFADGRIKGYPTTNKTFYARFCRGNSAYGTNAFIDNGDGTVTDGATGLMWSRSDSGEGMDWESALAWVREKNDENYLSHDDWRLPNAKELQSLVDYTRSPDTTGSAAIDSLFNATEITNEAGDPDYPFYWSSTTFLRFDGSAENAVYLAFGRGLGAMDGTTVIDVHGAGCQRSDPKTGDPDDYPAWGFGPQGDVQRVFNYIRLVRDTGGETPEPSGDENVYVSFTDSTCGGNSPCYASIQAAIDGASDGAAVNISRGTSTESLTLKSPKTVTLKGGWNAAFSEQEAGSTVIRAPKVTVGRMILREVVVGS